MIQLIASDLTTGAIDELKKDPTIRKYNCLKFTGNNVYFDAELFNNPKSVHNVISSLISKYIILDRVKKEILHIKSELFTKEYLKL
jgi:hypothetical protein